MEEADPENQRRMVTKSSIKRRPLANLTNIVRKPYNASSFSRSKKLKSFTDAAVSPVSDSSIGSTQNSIHAQHSATVPPGQPLPLTTQRLKPGDCLGDENNIAYNQRQTTQKTRSNTVPFNQTSVKKPRSNEKEGSMLLHSSTSQKVKDQGKGKKPSFDIKTGKNSMDTLVSHSTVKIKEKGKEICGQSSYPSMENTNYNVEDITMLRSLTKQKDKGKEIAVPFNDHPVRNLKESMMEVRVPLSGVKIKDKGKGVMGLDLVDRAKKDEGKAVATPIRYHVLGKDKESSCPPLLRTRSQSRNGAEDIFKSKSKTDHPPNKKKKRCSSKEGVERHALPQDFVDQQRAYFQEIDNFELEVEEVSV